jgi:hypothetical protein
MSFLLRKVGTKYRLPGDYFGVFAVAGGQLIPVSPKRRFGSEYRNRPVNTAIINLVALLHGR